MYYLLNSLKFFAYCNKKKCSLWTHSHWTYNQLEDTFMYFFFFSSSFFLFLTSVLSSPCLLFPVRHCFLVHNRWRVKIMAGNNWIFAQLTWRPAGEIRGGTPTIDRYLQIWFEKKKVTMIFLGRYRHSDLLLLVLFFLSFSLSLHLY